MPKPLVCDPELLQRDLSGRVYVVTGANSGIGRTTTEQLARQGAKVVMACRRTDEAEGVAREIREQIPGATLEVMALDLGDLDSVRAFAAALAEKHDALHGLVNNAGVMNTPKRATKQGFEMQIGVNHFGHFLLTELLLPLLEKGAPSRVAVVSSCYHDKAMGRTGEIDFEDLHFERRDYDGWKAYAQSKLANVLHAKALAKRLDGTDVTVASIHPGWVRTNLARHSMPLWVQNTIARPILHVMGMIEPWEGAQTTLYVLLADDVPEHSGAFYSQTGMYRDKAANQGGWPLRSPNPQVHDDSIVERFWELSREAVGLEAEAAAAE